MSRRHIRLLVLSVLVVAFTAIGAVVFAEWLATGTGTGDATAGEAIELRVEPGSSIGMEGQALVPGGTGDVLVVVRNDNTWAVEVREFTQDGPITSDMPGCDGATGEVTFFTQTGSWVIPPITDTGELPVTLSDALTMGTDAANACQGAAFTVPLAVTGGSDVGGSVTTTTSGSAAGMDFVLAFDLSASMSEDVAALKLEASTLASTISGMGPDGWARFGLVGFAEGVFAPGQAHLYTELTDPAIWLGAIGELPDVSDPGQPRAGLDAVVKATADEMAHRADAMTCVVIVTDEEPDDIFTVGSAVALEGLLGRNAQLWGLGPGLSGPAPSDSVYTQLAVGSGGTMDPLINSEPSQTPGRILSAVEDCVDGLSAGS